MRVIGNAGTLGTERDEGTLRDAGTVRGINLEERTIDLRTYKYQL